MKDKLELNYLAIKLRKELNEDEYSYLDIFEIVKKIDYLTIVLYPFSSHISGMCIKQDKANIIAINSKVSYGRQRFSLAHELYHLYYDKGTGTTISNINYEEGNETEQEANIFASYFLAPYNSLKYKLDNLNNIINAENLIKIENYYGFSHKGLLTRLFSENVITKEDYNRFLNIDLNKLCNKYGYVNSLYLPNDENNQFYTYGYYIIQSNKLKEMNRISNAKYNELMLDANRSDLIFSNRNKDAVNDWYIFLWYRLFI